MTKTDLVHLSGDGIRVAIDRRTGALARVESTGTGWRVTDRTELAAGFRLLIPLPGRRNNPADGVRQDPPEIRVDPSGGAITLSWRRVRSEHGGEHPIGVVQRISVTGRRVLFETTVDNRSEHTVENVWAPCLGDLRPPSADQELRSFCLSQATAVQQRLWPRFQGNCPPHGVDHPTQMASFDDPNAGATPGSPFMLVLARDQGMYVGVAERRDDLVSWRSELVPGYADTIARQPDPDATIRFSTVHLPFVAPGTTKALTPIALELFQGDWHTGADIYRRWRGEWMAGPTAPAWTGEPHAWLQLHLNSPEDELRLPFRELPEVGRECADAGIRAIQLVGWNEGGQDRGYPFHRPDPRLGTFEELHDAIARIQELGVKVVLFAKFTWGDRTAPRYSEIAADTVKDPYGDPYNGVHYRYQTSTQLLGVNVRHLIPMCFGSERYLAVCEREFAIIVALGAAGLLFDQCQHHADARLCFDPGHGHPLAWPVYGNDNELVRRFSRQTPRTPDFLYAGERLYDWEFERYHLSYLQSADPGHLPLHRYLLPGASMMTAVSGFDDRNMINQCLLYRYLISYEPFHFKGRPTDFPRTIAYGRQMDALRTELRDWFWDGTFRDTVGAEVRSADGSPHHPYAVHLHRHTREPALAVANYAAETASVRIEGIGSRPLYRLVGDDRWTGVVDGRLDLPPRSAAVVIPAGGTPRRRAQPPAA
ncbi:DUF6259 domain-containing protein [Streptomyces sp. NPDC059917]|uniref:DUF6259 domain-containing protein n=1 Tax=Streptomyces sp. NPDC059917 TaxID=3347002 RepID=UPI00365A31B8